MGVALDDAGVDAERCKETKEVVLGKEFFRVSKRFLMRELGLAISASARNGEREERERGGERLTYSNHTTPLPETKAR